MKLISIKIEDKFLRDLERIAKAHRYSTKTEFIREAIRDKLDKIEKAELLKNVDKLFGSSKRKTTDEDLHNVREKLAKLYEEFGTGLSSKICF
ncbi:MAG: ribbon-helix-helix domain-containing protein [Nanoarchaeota archaeon]|nr:ribbon-helix-helix domain-containing protein [Nanoarchaeota archaeon]MBU1103734.1 ribbon-helix-helix domain-containing protein [Nanoarchaeota archaeon]